MENGNLALQKPLSELIADQIKQDIWNRDIQFGARLLETELAKRFDVSRSTIREALKTLEMEELVISQARKGTYVADFTEQDLNEIIELRTLVESEAFAKAMSHLSDQHFSYLGTVTHEMKQKTYNDEWKSLFDLDMQFHSYIVNLCGNSRIIKLYNSLQVQIRAILMHLDQYYSSAESFYKEHEELLEALVTGQEEDVKEKVKTHIEFVEEKLLGMGNSL